MRKKFFLKNDEGSEWDLTDFKDRLITYRRYLHQHPELSFQEVETTKQLKQWLIEAGIKVIEVNQELGVIAEIGNHLLGPTIALRADMDALPIEEVSTEDYCSENKGVMHACGHDFHMAAILGAALLLKEKESQLKGKIRLIFQPAEEATTGAAYMIGAGAISDVDLILGFHNKPDLPVGTIGIRSGGLMAAVDRFEIEINGIGGHAGLPEQTIDPIPIGAQIITALQNIVSRRTSPSDQLVISVTKFQAGNTWNVIPEKAFLEGTVRSFNKDVRMKTEVIMREMVEGIGQINGAEVVFKWHALLPCVNNDKRFEATLWKVGEDLDYQMVVAEPVPGGEDFAMYQELIPGFFVWIGVDGPYAWHHPNFRLNEEALVVAASYFAEVSLQLLEEGQAQ